MYPLVPSILETSLESFKKIYDKEVKLPGAERIQVDFADGIFVPNKILDISEIPSLSPAFIWEAHLMIKEPKNFIDYKISGFETIIIHYEAYNNENDILNALKEIKSLGMSPALCFKIETSIEKALTFKELVNHFQLMSITPGFQGTPFFEGSYERIKKLRSLLPNAIIEVDGGVGLSNLKAILEAGANLVILGSVITKQPSMNEAYQLLLNEINKKD